MVTGGGYDLMLADIRMPGRDGMALLRDTTAVLPELSIVIITGHADMDVAVRALRLGAADFLVKPI